MNRIYPFLLLLLFCGFHLYATAPLETKGAAVGIYIAPVDSDAPVTVDYNSDMRLTPASVMKAITTATALLELGTEFRWETTASVSGALVDGTLQGNVTVQCTGDPTLESRFFADNRGFCTELAAALGHYGCRSVAGQLKIDQSRFYDSGVNPSWEIEDVAWDYGAGLYGANFRDNSFLLMLPECKVQPSVPGLNVVDRTVFGTGELLLSRGVGSDLLIAEGICRERGVRVWCSMPDPAKVMWFEADSTLRACGIDVDGGAIEDAGPEEVIMRHRSPRLAEVLRSLMVRSDNLMAEGVLRALAPEGTRSDAIKRMREIWKSRGIDLADTRILDGSGLARANAVSPRQIGSVLQWMARSSCSDDYVALFPKAGVDGTLRTFMAKSPHRCRFALKTGSMGGVQCYAGYRLDSTDGKPTHVVVVMVNNFTGSRAVLRKEVERMLSETVF